MPKTHLDLGAIRLGALAAHLWADAYDPENEGTGGLGGDENGEANDIAESILDSDVAEIEPAIPPDDLKRLRDIADDAADWAEANHDGVLEYMRQTERDEEQVGHDFALSRSGHGTGLWDRGAEHDLATRLHACAKVYGSVAIEYRRDEDGEVTNLIVVEG